MKCSHWKEVVKHQVKVLIGRVNLNENERNAIHSSICYFLLFILIIHF